MTWTIGVDVGGTFTGFYALDEAIGAVCLLFAFRNPAHENRIAAALRAALPGLPVCTSFEVQPEFREYERFSTTVRTVAGDCIPGDAGAGRPPASIDTPPPHIE